MNMYYVVIIWYILGFLGALLFWRFEFDDDLTVKRLFFVIIYSTSGVVGLVFGLIVTSIALDDSYIKKHGHSIGEIIIVKRK